MTTDVAERPAFTKEQLLEMLRESGAMDDLREELSASMPQGRFSSDNEGLEGIENGTGSGGFPWQYWKRRDGRVIYGPEPRETLYPIYMRKGYTPLPQYGRLPSPGSRVPCCNLSMKDHPYHVLMANGGAKELSIPEIIAAGWHIEAPTIHGKKITFPQLKGVEIEDIECPECDKRISGIAGTQQVIQTMRQHAKAVHDFSRRDVDEALWAIGYLSEERKTPPKRRRVAVTESE